MYQKVSNDPKDIGVSIPNLPSFANDGDCYTEIDSGDMWIFTNGIWDLVVSAGASGIKGIPGTPGIKGPDPTFQVMERTMFMEALRELAIFKKIEESEYFKLKRLYESVDVENRLLASNLVTELHNKLDKGV